VAQERAKRAKARRKSAIERQELKAAARIASPDADETEIKYPI